MGDVSSLATRRSRRGEAARTILRTQRCGSCSTRCRRLADLPDRCEAAIGILTQRRPSSRRGRRRRATAARRASRRADRRARALRRRGRARSSDGSTALGATRGQDVRRDGIRLSLRSGAPAALDRLSRRRRQPRSQLLRPARLRGAPGELRRDRQGRRAGPALVPARARPDAGRIAVRR